jgi:hypothetical protein
LCFYIIGKPLEINQLNLLPVLGIRIPRIRKFLGLPDPDR